MTRCSAWQEVNVADELLRQGDCATDLPRILDLLCHAFDQDPHINWMVRQDARRVVAIRHLFRLLLAPSRGGRLHVTPDLSAAALWFAPGEAASGLTGDLAFLLRYWPIASWKAALPKALRLRRLQSLRPNQPHYYLQLLAVAPAAQRRGLGSRLLDMLTARCDQEAVAAYLETSREDNAAFYARHGFRMVARTRLSAECTLLSMLRAPHSV
jgi:ribosomal protein S18 acetylase RimI-like enzyme